MELVRRKQGRKKEGKGGKKVENASRAKELPGKYTGKETTPVEGSHPPTPMLPKAKLGTQVLSYLI